MNKNNLSYQLKYKRNNDNKNGPIKLIKKNNNNNKIILNLNNSFSKEFTNIFESLYEDEDDNLLAQSYSYSNINKYKESFIKEPLNMILDSYIYDKNTKKRKIKYITNKDLAKFNNKLLSNKLNKNKEINEYLETRKNSIDEKNFKINFKPFLDETNLGNYYQTILNVKYSLISINSNNNVSPMFTIEHLFEEIISKSRLLNQYINDDELNNKYNKLKPIIYKYRQIKGDGNCYYRAVMFRYIENIILSGNTALLKKITLDMEKCFNSQEIKNRYKIKIDTIFKPDLHLKIMVLIIYLMEKRKIKEAHNIFVKCILSCAKYDYGMILYFRYIIYLYIKENENKLFSKVFPIKVGNLLPSIYENAKGEFEFGKFYINYLLKMFMEAEKIIIYLTPFILETNLDIIIFEDNEEQIVKRFSYEKKNSDINIKEDNVITLLNKKEHFELIYTNEEYNKYSNIFKDYEILEPNKNLSQPQDNNFFLLETNRNKNNNEKNQDNILNSKLKKLDNNTKNYINIDKYNNNENKGINRNIVNKDNNISITNDNIDDKQIKIKEELKIKAMTETPIGHPEYILNDNYLNKIDNLFINKTSNIECLKCKNKIIDDFFQDKYNLCNTCLENEILSQLKKEYFYYLNKGNFNNKFKINQIKIDKYTLYLKDIIDILKLFIDIKDEKQLKNYIKSFICIKCFKLIDEKKNNIVNLPCQCRFCDKDELENYFTVQNVISNNFSCICGYKYEPKDLYDLSKECYRIGSKILILFLINIFNKNILNDGCSGCGRIGKFEKIQYKPEDSNSFCFENYLQLNNININLDHNMCKECKRRYKNQQFVCYYCKKIHLFIQK